MSNVIGMGYFELSDSSGVVLWREFRSGDWYEVMDRWMKIDR